MDAAKFLSQLPSYHIPTAAHQSFSSSRLSLSPGQAAVISNGRLFGPLSPNEAFTADDFALIDRVGSSEIVPKVVKIVKKLQLEPERWEEILNSDVKLNWDCMRGYRI